MQYVFFTINRNQRKHLSTAWGLGGSILPEILYEDPVPQEYGGGSKYILKLCQEKQLLWIKQK